MVLLRRVTLLFVGGWNDRLFALEWTGDCYWRMIRTTIRMICANYFGDSSTCCSCSCSSREDYYHSAHLVLYLLHHYAYYVPPPVNHYQEVEHQPSHPLKHFVILLELHIHYCCYCCSYCYCLQRSHH